MRKIRVSCWTGPWTRNRVPVLIDRCAVMILCECQVKKSLRCPEDDSEKSKKKESGFVRSVHNNSGKATETLEYTQLQQLMNAEEVVDSECYEKILSYQ